MKKLFFVFAVLIVAESANAQLFNKERLSNLENFDKSLFIWGFFLGYNSYDYKFIYKNQFDDHNTDVQVSKEGGLNVGLIGDIRINKYINIRFEPGLSFTKRNLVFPGFTQEKDYLREVKSTYIYLPLLLKISTKRFNNFKPFIIGGVSTSSNLSSNENHPEDNAEGQFRTTESTLFYELGIGIDLYLFFFKFTPSIRGVFSLNDELIKDDDPNSPWTGNIEKMSSRGVFINFTFQ